MYFTDLIRALKAHIPVQVVSEEMMVPIRTIRLLDGHESTYRDDTLYLGYSTCSPLPTQMILAGEEPKDRVGQNLALIEADQLFAVYNLCLKILDEDHPDRFLRDLKTLSINAKDLPNFINLLAEKLNNPLILLDQDYRVSAYSDRFIIQDPLWSKVVDRGYCRYPLIKASERSAPYQRDTISREAYLAEMCEHTPTPKIYSKIFYRDAYWGAILLLEERSPITFEDYRRLPQVSRALEKVFNRIDYAPEVGRDKTDKIFYRLLVGAKLEDLDREELEMNPDGHYVLLALRSNDDFQNTRLDHLRSLLPTASVARIQKDVILLVPLAPGEAMPREVVRYLSDLAEKDTLCIGISTPFRDLDQVSSFYDQAIHALKFPLGPPVKAYSRTSFAKLLQDFARLHPGPISWKDYLHPALGQLKAYDEKNKTELYQTLKVYLLYSSNIKEISSALYLHRNTVKYRLDRISEITQLSLDDKHLLFFLSLSFAIQEYLDHDIIH